MYAISSAEWAWGRDTAKGKHVDSGHALLSSDLHGVASAACRWEASGKDLGSVAWIQPPSQLPLSPSLDFPVRKMELTIISISKGVS